ncbi:MAG TPA: HAD family hydrolase [Roseimicrobium sp.]|nr:HAD family hydrolase [Roseimicrobium sp.]
MSLDNRLKVHMEFSEQLKPSPHLKHIVFDFDGTVSLLRGGWADIMLTQYLRHLPPQGHEDSVQHQAHLLDIILSLNGRPTIHQMIRLVDEMKKRGLTANPVDLYQAEFQQELISMSAARMSAIRQGQRHPDEFLVPGTRPLLELLTSSGFAIYLLSGTHHCHLIEETACLGIDHFFSGGIFGPDDDDTAFSKRTVLEQILKTSGAAPAELLSFGDGPVELRETRSLGGTAIAIACDEAEPLSGRLDPHKHGRLLSAGAHGILADYRDLDSWLPRVFSRPGTEAH